MLKTAKEYCFSLLSVPDDGYPRNVSCALNFISTLLLLLLLLLTYDIKNSNSICLTKMVSILFTNETYKRPFCPSSHLTLT
jgi:hypothetical protein